MLHAERTLLVGELVGRLHSELEMAVSRLVRRERLELLAQAFEPPCELSLVISPDVSIVDAMTGGELEGIVLKDRTSTYRDGSRAGWVKVKDPARYTREAWRFDRRLI